MYQRIRITSTTQCISLRFTTNFSPSGTASSSGLVRSSQTHWACLSLSLSPPPPQDSVGGVEESISLFAEADRGVGPHWAHQSSPRGTTQYLRALYASVLANAKLLSTFSQNCLHAS